MTPEEILAECRDLNEIGEAAGVEVEHQLIELQNNIGKLFTQAAVLLAQARKEARELREQNAKLLKALDLSQCENCDGLGTIYYWAADGIEGQKDCEQCEQIRILRRTQHG